MVENNKLREELIGKYKLAGRIRFISFSLLLFFLFIMKTIGGYSYLNGALITLILVEAILNQPYNFITKRVDIYRFQYYQMITDIMVISWVIYYMGGIEAPLVSIAYYVIILWAGVVSSIQAVFFAVIASAVSFALVVIFEHFGMLPFISYYGHKMPTTQMFSLLFGNVSFLFAFGYFSAHSSKLIKFLQRKRQEESLRSVHKYLATGYLVGSTAHDILNCLASIKAYTNVLLNIKDESLEKNDMIKSIERLEKKGTDLVSRLSRFSIKTKHELESIDINKVIEDSIGLTWPLVKYSKMSIEKLFGSGIPLIMADKDNLQEAFVAMIFNALDAIINEGTLTIKTNYLEKDNFVEIVVQDTGKGIKPEHLRRIQEPFFTTKSPEKGVGMGLTTAYEIIARHNGKINVQSTVGKGTTFTIRLPVKQPK